VALLLCVGCVSEAQYMEMKDQFLAERSNNRQAVERLAYLDSENIRLRAQLLQAGLKIEEADKIREAYAHMPQWPQIEGTTRGKEGELIIEDEVLFASGQHALQPTGRSVLDQVAQAIIKENAGAVRIEGHTDTDPIVKTKDKYDSNFHLSAMRALSVLAYLRSKGVPADKMYVAGFGEFRPRGSDKSKNRRVEIRLFK
jgi:chemotaxis protein MotB